MESSEDSFDISLKAGKMYLNRFCIDEAAAFELSGVHYLQKSSNKINFLPEIHLPEKGKEYSFVYLEVFLVYPGSFILTLFTLFT